MTRMWRSYPVILVPFVLTGVSYAAVLAVIFSASQLPFSTVVAPVIRAFWGEQFLHYPYNLVLLPKLFGYGKIGADLAVGVLLTATAVAMMQQAYQATQPGWLTGLKKGVRRYFRVGVVWAMMLVAAMLTAREVDVFLGPLIGVPLLRVAVGFLAGILVQIIFVFAIPAIVIDNRKTLAALRHGLRIIAGNPGRSLALVAIPNLLFIPVLYAYLKLPRLMELVAPEAALYAVLARIVLAVAVDVLVATGATVLFLQHKESTGGVRPA
jgi:hypothetical protein